MWQTHEEFLKHCIIGYYTGLIKKSVRWRENNNKCRDKETDAV